MASNQWRVYTAYPIGVNQVRLPRHTYLQPASCRTDNDLRDWGICAESGVGIGRLDDLRKGSMSSYKMRTHVYIL